MAIDISVGQVAGLIAFLVFAVQLYIPDLMVFILAANLGRENTAVTWSLAAQAAQKSNWSAWLPSEAAKTKSVRWKIFLIATAPTILVACLSIVGIVTPLGLHSTLLLSRPKSLSFQYARDTSAFATSTELADSDNLNRICLDMFHDVASTWRIPGIYDKNITCPYMPQKIVSNWHNQNESIPINIPLQLRSRYTSGLKHLSDTISSIFDVQWRSLRFIRSFPFNNGEPFLTNDFRILESRILRKQIYLIQGLLVDPVQHRIALRNHTAHAGYTDGAKWTEDLLFFTPTTKCVDLNITMDYSKSRGPLQLKESYAPAISFVRLTDRGGIADVAKAPKLHLTPYEPGFNDVDLLTRAKIAAQSHNEMLANWLDVPQWRVSRAHLSNANWTFLGPAPLSSNVRYPFSLLSSFETVHSNMHMKRGLEDVAHISGACQNISLETLDKSYSIAISCGILQGPARVIGPLETHQAIHRQHYSVPLYSCATSIAADIKQVTFSSTESFTDDIQAISVDEISDKTYTSKTPPPLWGIENTNMSIFKSLPMWGVIDEETSRLPDIWSLRKPSLNLPGAILHIHYFKTALGGKFMSLENFPGIDWVSQTLASTYLVGSNRKAPPNLDYYSGEMIAGLEKEWIGLSATAEGAAKIPNRIWTDLAANAIMGSRGVLGSQNGHPHTKHNGRVRYKAVRLDYRFAVPAFLISLITLIFTCLAGYLLASGTAGFQGIRRLLHYSSVGRILTASEGVQGGDFGMSEKAWSEGPGLRVYNLSGQTPTLSLPVPKKEYASSTESSADSE